MKIDSKIHINNPVITNVATNKVTPTINNAKDSFEPSYFAKYKDDLHLKYSIENYGQDFMGFAKDLTDRAKLANEEISPRSLTWYYTFVKLKSEDVYNHSYALIKKELNLENIVPKLDITSLSEDPENPNFKFFGGYNAFNDTTQINKNLIKEQCSPVLIEALRHETEHSQQYTLIARTEGLGIEAIARVDAINSIRECLNSKEPINSNLYRYLQKQKLSGIDFKSTEGKSILKKAENILYKDNIELLKQNQSFKNAISTLGTIKADSTEGLKANEYLKSILNYIPATVENYKGYRANLIEDEAHTVARKFVIDILESNTKIINILKGTV